MQESNKLTDLIKESLTGIKDMINCETVMGEPINTPSGTTVIPVSRVSLGYASGGLDYFKKNAPKAEAKSDKDPGFAGGGGLGMSLTPLGFLVITSEGRAEFLSIEAANNVPAAVNIINSAVDVIERSPEIIEKLKKIFTKEDKKEDEKTEKVEKVETKTVTVTEETKE